MDIGEQEARRADNQIWNAAGAYGFATGSRGYEPNGEASLYFNTAIGLVRQLYDYKKLELLFTALERHSGGELQSELLWLGLERCAYLRCRDARPALTFLRRDYAQRQLQQDFSVNSEQDRLKIGWFRRALGLPSEESDREKQILDALGAESLELLQKQTAQLWTENSWDDGLVTSTLANSIWLRDGYNYNSETLQKLGEDFYASAFSGEMGSDAYNNILRDWINEHTGNLLTEQAGKLELNADTVLALVSTLYYSASWHDKFSSAATTQDVFHAPNGDVSTDFLHSSDSNTVYYGDGFSAIGLSLENSGRMWLLKPDEGVDAAELLQNEDTLGFLLANGEWSQTQRAIVNLSLPKFDVSSDLDILDTLAQLGMTDVLDGIKSDFTPLTAANDSLALTQAKHAARVKIDEDGCEAAAYTILGVEATAMMGPEDEIDFTLDNPFVFAITGIDGLPLFVGLVNQPN